MSTTTNHARMWDRHVLEILACRRCVPPGATGVPLPPSGRARPGDLDVLLVGRNPPGSPSARSPASEVAGGPAVGEGAHGSIEASAAELLPIGLLGVDGRAASTWIWRWPTIGRTRADDARAHLCAVTHLWKEVDLLRPRLIVTHDDGAAGFFLARARERGVPVGGPPSVVRGVAVVGYSDPSLAWGWPMALLLASSTPLLKSERDWVRRKGRELLDAATKL